MSAALRVGIAGLGTVGAGVVKIVQEQGALLQARSGRSIEVTAVSARSKSKDRGIDLSNVAWVDDAAALAARDDVDVVVEVIGGHEGVAKQLCSDALSNGKHVVTANKALVAHHAKGLCQLANDNNVSLWFEASTAGGTPIISMIREGLTANNFSQVAGILNGTCNFILTTMEKTGRDYEDVLQEADDLGYLEADPSLDIDGIDTAHKLAILSGLCFGHVPSLEPLPCLGIRHITLDDIRYAKELGYRIKLLGMASKTPDGVQQEVAPYLVPLTSPMANVDASFNAIELLGDQVGRIYLEGKGAGPGPTASAVVADLVGIARGLDIPTLNYRDASLQAEPFVKQAADITYSYYLRLNVVNRAGVLAEATNILKEAGASMKDVSQHAGEEGEPAQIIFITHKASDAAIRDALAKLEAMDSVLQAPQHIRIAS